MKNEKIFQQGLLGKKLGMTHVFAEDGTCVPVTIIQAGPCYVLDVKTADRHGYSSVQFGFEPKKAQRCSKPALGHFGKAGKGAFYHVREVRCDVQQLGWTTPGQAVTAGDVFQAGEHVDVSGVSIGRGFSGVVRRYKVGGQPATRGTHEYRRHIGAVGCRKFPARIFKNQRMPGHMGAANRTAQNLEIVQVNPETNIVLVRGGVPGARGGLVMIRKTVKGVVPSGLTKSAGSKESSSKAA